MDADGTLMEQPSSRLEPQRHRDHGASPFLVVDLPKDLFLFLFPLPFASLRETQNPCQQCRAANRLLLAIPPRGFAGLDARHSDFLSWFFGWRAVKGF